MFKRQWGKARALLWSLIFEYHILADWSADTSRVLTLRINKWTKTRTIVEETLIQGARPRAYHLV